MGISGESNGRVPGAHASTGPIRPSPTNQCFNNLERNYSSAAQCVNNSGYYDFKELSPSRITINPTSGLIASAWLSQTSSARSQIEGGEKNYFVFLTLLPFFFFFFPFFCFSRLWTERHFAKRKEGMGEEGRKKKQLHDFTSLGSKVQLLKESNQLPDWRKQ